MCRIEERMYVDEDGRRRTIEQPFLCQHARNGRPCSNTRKKVVDFPIGPPLITRDDTSSPASTYNPPTPTGSGTYILEERAPSHSRKGSNAGGSKRVIHPPEIIIQIGSSKKDKGKDYRGLTSKSYKRSSLGAASTMSPDIAVESPSSDASFTIRTGFPEAPMSPATPICAIRPAGGQGHGYSNSASSIVSQAPSLYGPSEPGSPSLPRPSRYGPTVVHNPTGDLPLPSPSTQGPPQAAPVAYRTKIVEPRDSAEQVHAEPRVRFEHSDLIDSIGASHFQSKRENAPEIFGRDAERTRLRQARAEAERKEERAEREKKEAEQLEEEARQARLERARFESRASERAENSFAYRELRRMQEREEARKLKDQERAAEEAHRKRKDEDAAEEARQQQRREANQRTADAARRKAGRQPEEAIVEKERQVKDAEAKLRKREHRRSMYHSQPDAAALERKRLLAETHAQMAIERQAAEQREREEEAALAAYTMSAPSSQGHQQQPAVDPHYYDPRGGSRNPGAGDNVGLGRRNSISARRNSISSAALPAPLGRTSSKRRPPIVQPAPPSSLSSHSNAFSSIIVSSAGSQTSYTRPPSARHSSYDMENPFAAPPTRLPQASQNNAFVQPGESNAFDTRNLREAVPMEPARTQYTRQYSDDRHHHQSSRRRGEEGAERIAEGRSRRHDGARQATHTMHRVVVTGDYANEEEDERWARRDGAISGKRRN